MVKVNIHWYKKDEGGRHLPPTTREYSTIARFDDETNWPKISWSIILYFDTPPSVQDEDSIGFAKFLSSNAPVEKLKSGVQFELYEGYKRVALVSVI